MKGHQNTYGCFFCDLAAQPTKNHHEKKRTNRFIGLGTLRNENNEIELQNTQEMGYKEENHLRKISSIPGIVCPDPMHVLFSSGIFSKFLNNLIEGFYIKSENRTGDISIAKLDDITIETYDRISSTLYPSKRKPKSLKKISFYKASDFKMSFLVLVPCILSFCLKSNTHKTSLSIFLLLISGVTQCCFSAPSQSGEILIRQFYEYFQQFFSTSYCTLKLHEVYHLSEVYERLGLKLSEISCFGGEGYLKKLKNLLSNHSQGNILLQLQKRILVDYACSKQILSENKLKKKIKFLMYTKDGTFNFGEVTEKIDNGFLIKCINKKRNLLQLLLNDYQQFIEFQVLCQHDQYFKLIHEFNDENATDENIESKKFIPISNFICSCVVIDNINGGKLIIPNLIDDVN
uniref:Uncharacterized protein n=1 Tax=Strongyloides venezuelensis TaxID=75913 RepID=A0A0K0FGV7_STRVS